ncbi:MAG TPA: transglycosylase domain-containing protein [Pyrinomonadaceae bacterium]|jgi:membrane peptidoglycan carboxypeptidase|nr:transglycosylase domain-containing protein [Pyrinomonadaceae bacterium]
MKAFASRTSRIGGMFISLFLTLQTLVFCVEYYKAVSFLQDHDPRQSANMTGTIVYAHPVQVFVGQLASRKEIVDHLMSIGFKANEKPEPGSFSVAGNRLSIRSRLTEFPELELIFGGQRIVKITANGKDSSSAQIEPETLASFVRLIKDNKSYPMWIRRHPVQSAELIPSTLYDAVRSSEDKRFESHNGLDYLNLARAVFERRGGSTITQQMVKNAILQDQSRTLTRKWNELALALAVERRYTKAEIFTTYANNVYCGRIAGGPVLYGFAALSEEIFGTIDLKSLGLGRAAVLAGMLDQPEKYLRDARNNHYEAIQARRNRVLDLIARNYPDKYSAAVVDNAKREQLAFEFISQRHELNPLDTITRHFQLYAADNLNLVGLQKSEFESGFRLYTTIDANLQRGAQAALDNAMPRFDALLAHTKAGRRATGMLEASVVAIDPRDGEIIAMTGGRNFKDSEYNCALAQRSVGSTIKPFLYALGLASGQNPGPFTAATIIDPRREGIAENFRPTSHVGGPSRARVLLARSDNGAGVAVLNMVGIDRFRQFIQALTGSSPGSTGMIAIGGGAGSEFSPLQLARAYAIFPNQGLMPSLTPFAAAFREGNPLKINETSPARMLDPGAAFVTAEMCRSVVGWGPDGNAGTAKNAPRLAGLESSVNVAGKTGTGQTSDVWFVGFTPRLVVVVWLGHTSNVPLPMSSGFSGAGAAMPIWASFMRVVAKHRPDLLAGNFEQPENVRSLAIDRNKGCLKDDGVNEYFIKGREAPRCSK